MSSPTDEISTLRRPPIVLFLLAALVLGLSFFFDDSVILWVQEHVTKAWRNLAGEISDYGDWPWLMLYASPFLLAAWWKKRTLLLRIVVTMMVASTVAGLADNAVRLTTGRARPNAKIEEGWYGMRHEGKWIVGKNKFASFPSAHTAAAFGFFGVAALQKRRGAWLWFLPALAIGASRIAINAHHLSDVCYGAWIGLLVACWLVRWKKGACLTRRRVFESLGKCS